MFLKFNKLFKDYDITYLTKKNFKKFESNLFVK